MACNHPIPAYRSGDGAVVTFGYSSAAKQLLRIPCGKCRGCRQDRATQWAHRCAHEAQLYDCNTFLTLTYDDEHLNRDNLLVPRHLTLFWKRLRRTTNYKIRYFACGEYGESNGRPHYHALIFNWRPQDLKRAGAELYQADSVRKLWPHGEHKLGDATSGAAGYIAKYALKGDRGDPRAPSFLRMSNGIGRDWLATYATDLQHGYIISNGKKQAIPRYYRKKIQQQQPLLHQAIQSRLDHYATIETDKHDRARQLDNEKILLARKQQRS